MTKMAEHPGHKAEVSDSTTKTVAAISATTTRTPVFNKRMGGASTYGAGGLPSPLFTPDGDHVRPSIEVEASPEFFVFFFFHILFPRASSIPPAFALPVAAQVGGKRRALRDRLGNLPRIFSLSFLVPTGEGARQIPCHPATASSQWDISVPCSTKRTLLWAPGWTSPWAEVGDSTRRGLEWGFPTCWSCCDLMYSPIWGGSHQLCTCSRLRCMVRYSSDIVVRASE